MRDAALASLGFFAVVAATAAPRHQALAIYAVSYWHYYAYWLAFRYGRVGFAAFKRHAILLKSVSLLALGTAYFGVTINPTSLAVVAAGFLLNAAAARALGADRTYYGHEVAGLPRQRIYSFPYQWISHPMLVGNMAAFGGTLLNPDFRREWWPLAAVHVGLNLALLVMELKIMPLGSGDVSVEVRSTTSTRLAWAAGMVAGAWLLAAVSTGSIGAGQGIPGAILATAALLHFAAMQFGYTRAPVSSRGPRPLS